jgi:hypothetical protein
MNVQSFVKKWSDSGAAERANKDHFLLDLCEVLDVPKPKPATGDPERDVYTFERDAVLLHEGQKTSVGRMDLYKADHFILEAKQGSDEGAAKKGTAKRGTAAWNLAMHDAFGQAVGYARTLAKPPPFVITTDIGYCFELFAAFDGTGRYSQFPDVKRHRIYLQDLGREENLELLRTIFTEPASLDPSRRATKVTREVAARLAELAKDLEKSKHAAERVAKFLMRAIFTMFAEDVGLLPDRIFTDALEKYWLPSPASFPGGIRSLWKAMNDGGDFFIAKLLQFNGGLFADADALPLTKKQLELLREAASCDWSEVEPSIFGTLLERALDPIERHKLGAHYTPRAYVERLVRPTVEEPLREEWDLVRAQVRALVKKEDIKGARKALLAFQTRLAGTRVLDPACGTGNFLYVTLDLMKRLEAEVLAMLSDVEGGERGHKAGLASERHGFAAVTPRQFLGIEVKPWAKEIAELVLWIGYLQWHFRTHGRDEKPAEPVLHDYKNIECRDAVLSWDKEELARDEKGKPLSRWDGRTMKKSPVTGEEIPDETARVPLYKYVNPRRAEWPKADFIVGNPPFIGNKRMRLALGDGYVEALRKAHDDVPETADFVMYWWNVAATLVRAGSARRFGLITTNSITQKFNRPIIEDFLGSPQGSVAFAIPDHPWVDSADGAQVRIAMTVGTGQRLPGVVHVVSEEEPELRFSTSEGSIPSGLVLGASVTTATPLEANRGLACPGVQLSGQGFVLGAQDLSSFSAGTRRRLVRRYITGKDLAQVAREQYVLDTFGLREAELREKFADAYQWLLERVRPERAQNPRDKYAREWWLHSEPRARFRSALHGLRRYICTSRTARHRAFQFVGSDTLPETKVLIIALEEGWQLGVLSSLVHVLFATAAGGWLGVGNDSTYNHSECFDKFPFPAASENLKARIAKLADSLEYHRKRQQAAHPDLTITGMYNVLEKLRSGEPLTAKEKVIHDQGLVSVLKQLHDDLDAAVFDAYGWPKDLTDEQILERLVKLNAERAAEEAKGLVRWLRPEFQAAGAKAKKPTQVALIGTGEPDKVAATGKSAKQPWPKALPEQIAAIRTLLGAGDALSVKATAAAFNRADKGDVETSLDALVALGLAVAFGKGDERRWRAAGRVAA